MRKNPASFADVARKNSQDPGSAERGGDLDFFGRGAMVKPFEDAVFAMKRGEISNVVESDFGFHIITLTDLRGGEKKPFEAVRAEIEAEVRKSLAQRRWAEAAEQFTNTVYEQADSLQPVVDKSQAREADRHRAAHAGAGCHRRAGLRQAAAGGVRRRRLRNKRNTDAVEVGPNQLASARVVEHTPARTLPLAEVRERRTQRVWSRSRVRRWRARKARPGWRCCAQAPAEALPSTLIDLAPAAAEPAARRCSTPCCAPTPAKLPAVAGVDLGAQGYVVLACHAGAAARGRARAATKPLRLQYAQAWAAAEADAYLGALKKRFKVEIKAAASAAGEAASAPAALSAARFAPMGPPL